jgi:dCMP deaminase
MAHEVAKWSKDPSTQVGARITRGKILVSEGFNGPPAGMQDDPTISREAKLRRTIHAERNAVLFAQRDLSGCTIYVTHHPCSQCAALISQAGITRVVCPRPAPDFATRWAEDITEAQSIFRDTGVTLELVEWPSKS